MNELPSRMKKPVAKSHVVDGLLKMIKQKKLKLFCILAFETKLVAIG